jgi:catechol 2,3-dioxygenase-like lactoylglutathione lyase family enzyme
MGISDGAIEPNKDVHLAFAVSEFDAYLKFLSDHGVVYGTFAGRSDVAQVRPDGVRQIFFQDPDGNWIEVNDAVHSIR